MSIVGSCRCKNFKVNWHCFDYSMVPRACQCSYCLSKNASYVSKSGTRFEVYIKDKSQHNIVQQGSRSALFHECTNCQDLVCVTVEIEGIQYGVLNSTVLKNKFGFVDSHKMNFEGQSNEQKQQRWQNNWCYPVIIG